MKQTWNQQKDCWRIIIYDVGEMMNGDSERECSYEITLGSDAEINVSFPADMKDWTADDCLRLCRMIYQYNVDMGVYLADDLNFPWCSIRDVIGHEYNQKEENKV